MTQITPTQQVETAGENAAAKLQVFLDGLTPDEQQAIERGLRRLVALVDASAGEAAGHAIPTALIVRLAAELRSYQQWAEAFQSGR
ncbi:MAG: hypothetical protein ACRDJE_28210 [Dehalococcoidia bacterium]